jgi:NADH-quinone oxidoreductase subunit L
MTFVGAKRWAADAHPHESPRVMTVPLIVLGVLSTIGGAALLYIGGGIVEWLEPVTGEEHLELGIPVWAMTVIILAVVLVGAFIAWQVFGRQPVPVTQPTGSAVTVAARRDLYGDAVNEAVFMRPGQYLTRSLVYVDNRGIDGAVVGTASGVGQFSTRLRRWQTGFVRSYALSMLAGAAIVVIAMLVVRWP